MLGFVNGLLSGGAFTLRPAHEDYYFESGAGMFTVPRGAKRMFVTLIGGGGSSGSAGYGYNTGTGGGGGGGGSGGLYHSGIIAAAAGERIDYAVGGIGAASTFGAYSAAGGEKGKNGNNVDLSNTDLYHKINGGAGGAGSIGGEGGSYGINRYGKGGDAGAVGKSLQTWNEWDENEWYCFRDSTSERRLGNAGSRGVGYAGAQYGNGAPLSRYEAETKKGTAGLVAVRVYFRSGAVDADAQALAQVLAANGSARSRMQHAMPLSQAQLDRAYADGQISSGQYIRLSGQITRNTQGGE